MACLMALVVYDLRWMKLPNQLVYPLGTVVVLFKLVEIIHTGSFATLVSGLVGSLLLGGFFLLVYQISNGKWIGGGDVRFGFIMGGLLGWQKGLLGLALSSYIGVFCTCPAESGL